MDELGTGGSSTARYTQGLGIDEPLAMYRGGVASYYHADGLGSIEALTDAMQKVAAGYLYDSFGNLTSSTGTLTNPFRYTARQFDSDTGLYYYRARYYDPTVGRFLSEDPVWLPNGRSMYDYTENSPATFTDPLGLFTITNLIRQHRTLGIENVCPPESGGACTIRLTAGLSCDCRCDGTGWKAAADLRITGDLFVWNGQWPYHGRQPRDRRVHDAASAITHEYAAHIDPAIMALGPSIKTLEDKKFKSKDDCEAGCKNTSKFVNTLFGAVLGATQKEEEGQR